MLFIDAMRKAGRNGVIARAGQTAVLLIRRFDEKTGRAVIVQVTDNDIGNWTPSEEDRMARDWEVVARSVQPF